MNKNKKYKKNTDSIKLFHWTQQRLHYVPLWAEMDRAPLQTTVPYLRKKKYPTKEKVGSGLFSFRALSDMTATMKRAWL